MNDPVKSTGKTLCEVFAAELKSPEEVKHLKDDFGTVLRCPECKTPLVRTEGDKAGMFPFKCPNDSTPCGHGIFSPDYLCGKMGYYIAKNGQLPPVPYAELHAPTKAEAMAELAPKPNKASQISTNPKDRIGDTKPDLSLIPGALSIEVAGVMGLGARKYGPYNWRENKVRARVYIAAAQRHLLQYLDGDDTDIESGFSHLAHAAACCGIILDAASLDCLVDDRPAKGAATALLTKHTQKK